MAYYEFPNSTLTDGFLAKEKGFAAFARSTVDNAPWFIASFLVHVVLFSALALLAVGGVDAQTSIDISSEFEQKETPLPTLEEESQNEPEPVESDRTEEALEEVIDEIEEQEEITGDPEAPSEQPLSDDTLGALGPGCGSPTGAYGKTRGSGRKKLVKEKGGTFETEKGVEFGLKWLAEHQESDGHWDTKKWGGHGEYDPGNTGLALLAFAGAGNTETSGRYKQVVRRAISWLADAQDAKGCFAPKTTMYSHAIPTLALLEIASMSPVVRTKLVAEKGLRYILSAQNDYKAWRYWPKDGDNDISVTTWCVMALKAAAVAGIDVPAGAWAGVKTFLDEVTEDNYGEVGYTARPIKGGSDNQYQRYSMTACGLLCRLYLGVPRTDRIIKLGVQILMENLPEWNQPGIAGGTQFYYYWYYGSLVLFQIEGDQWKRWNTKMRDMLVQYQNWTPGELYGSWDPTSATHFCQMGGRVYSTAMAVLTLEVYYRFQIIANSSEK